MAVRTMKMLVICLLTTHCIALEPAAYYSAENHFSFVLPEDWEFIRGTEFSEIIHETSQTNKIKSELLGMCRKVGASYLETQYIVVYCLKHEGLSEVDIEAELKSGAYDDRAREAIKDKSRHFKEVYSFVPDSWQGAELLESKFEYNDLKHFSFVRMKLKSEKGREIVLMEVKLLGQGMTVVLRGFSEGQNIDVLPGLIDRIIDSFSYDKGFGFGEQRLGLLAKAKKHFGTIFLAIYTILVCILICLICGRYIKSKYKDRAARLLKDNVGTNKRKQNAPLIIIVPTLLMYGIWVVGTAMALAYWQAPRWLFVCWLISIPVGGNVLGWIVMRFVVPLYIKRREKTD